MKPEFADEFTGPGLDTSKWIPHYLPHWSSRAQAAARYSFGTSGLVLRIDADQEPWCPEFDGGNKTSTLQTAANAGQSRFRDDLVVHEEQLAQRLYLMHHGYVEIRLKALADPDAMVALWMIGYEDEPERSGEICVCEIFGRDTETGLVRVGMGVHPFGDPAIVDDFTKVPVEIDIDEFHTYGANWTSESVEFFVDGERVKTVGQSPGYPLQLMLGIFEFPRTDGSAPGPYPKEFEVDYIRVYGAD